MFFMFIATPSRIERALDFAARSWCVHRVGSRFKKLNYTQTEMRVGWAQKATSKASRAKKKKKKKIIRD
jgi:hypothetical protein